VTFRVRTVCPNLRPVSKINASFKMRLRSDFDIAWRRAIMPAKMPLSARFPDRERSSDGAGFGQ